MHFMFKTVTFSRETRQTNRPVNVFAKPRKSKIQLERKLFFEKSQLFLIFLRDGERRQILSFGGGLSACEFCGFGEFGEFP